MRSVFLQRALWISFLAVVPFSSFSHVMAATKVRYVTGSLLEVQRFPVIAGQEQGIWEKHGLAIEWVEVRGDPMAMKALVGGKVDAGNTSAIALVWAAARGVPAVITTSVSWSEFFIWVRSQSAIHVPSDLKGKRIAVTSLGGTVHSLGRAAVKALGLEKDVMFVATGGNPESLAALRAGWVDGTVIPFPAMAKMKLAGVAREVLSVGDYLPKDFAGSVLYLHRRQMRDDPSTARNLAAALVDVLRFLGANPGWVIDKMKTEFGRTEQEARLVLEKGIRFSPDGKLSRQEIQNVSDFLVQYGLIPKGALPPLDEYFAPAFPR